MRRLLGAVSGLALLLSSVSSSQGTLPAETRGFAAATDSLIAAYAGADVMVLGEAHGRKPDSDFRIALIRHAKFAATVRVIVLETAQPELVAAIDEINQALPPQRRVQVFVNQTPTGADRNATAVALVREHALDKRQKALVVFGSGHVWRRFGGVTKLLEQQIGARVLVVETIAPVQPSPFDPPEAAAQFAASSRALEATLHSRQWPVLISLAGTTAGKLIADPFYMGQAMLGSQVTLGDLADAVVYFRSALTFSSASWLRLLRNRASGILRLSSAPYPYAGRAFRLVDQRRTVYHPVAAGGGAIMSRRG